MHFSPPARWGLLDFIRAVLPPPPPPSPPPPPHAVLIYTSSFTNGLRQHVYDQCLRQTFRTAYETQGKSYDKMEFMQAQY